MAVPQHPARNEYFEGDADEELLSKERAPLDEMPNSEFTSSNVHSGLYDFGTRELFMRYKRRTGADAIYRYDNVPARTWKGLTSAASKGSFVNSSIAFEFNYVRINRSDIPEEDRYAVGNAMIRRFLTTP